MQFIFHIGMGKTGTSALQSTLFKSAEYLETRRVLYPRNPAQPRARDHKLYVVLAKPHQGRPRSVVQMGNDAHVQALLKDLQSNIESRIAQSPPALLLMSSEAMFTVIHRDQKPLLHAALTGFGASPQFVAYVRRPSDRYLSGLQQHLKAAANTRIARPPNYRRTISNYQNLFGKDCLQLHLYHREALQSGDVVADFVARHLAPYGVETAKLTPPGAGNVSLGAESMALMQSYRARFHAERHNKKTTDSIRLRRRLLEADRAVGVPRPRLKPEIAAMIDYASDDPLWLRDQFGIVFPGFDYALLEAGHRSQLSDAPLDLDEIIAIDPARVRKILEFLVATRWALGNKRRKEWIGDVLKTAGASGRLVPA